MFARVITAQAGDNGFGDLVQMANHELPAARQRPGFAGYYLLTDDSTGNVIIISMWQSAEDMKAAAQGTATGIHDESVPASGLNSLRLETYEVAVRA